MSLVSSSSLMTAGGERDWSFSQERPDTEREERQGILIAQLQNCFLLQGEQVLRQELDFTYGLHVHVNQFELCRKSIYLLQKINALLLFQIHFCEICDVKKTCFPFVK